jgi:hypothetical protein
MTGEDSIKLGGGVCAGCFECGNEHSFSRYFLTRCGTVRFSRISLLRGVNLLKLVGRLVLTGL